MQNLIPCRFHVEVKTVLKTEGLRATKQRLDIGTNFVQQIIIVILNQFSAILKKRKLMFQEQHYIELLMCLLSTIF